MYAGIAILFFFLVIYLQQVAGYSALRSGLVTLPVTIEMFVLSRRFGALADRLGPRFFMGCGPLVAAGGILLLLRLGMNVSYWTDLLPALLVFGVGLSMTVAPLTATVLADADESDAGIASAINNSVARIAGLVGVSVIGVVVAGTLVGDTFAANQASVRAFHEAMAICAALVAAGGLTGLLGIVNPRRTVQAEACPGGQLVGAPEPAAAARPQPRRRQSTRQPAGGMRWTTHRSTDRSRSSSPRSTSSGSRRPPEGQARATANGSRRSASRSTSAGTCSGSAVPCATPAEAPMTPRRGRPRWWSATSSRQPLSELPPLPLAEWELTKDTLHLQARSSAR